MSGLLIEAMPEWWTAETTKTVAPLLAAALAEAGYPVKVETRIYLNGTLLPSVDRDSVPVEVFNRARSLVFQRFNVPYEWCPNCPDGYFNLEWRHSSRCGVTS